VGAVLSSVSGGVGRAAPPELPLAPLRPGPTVDLTAARRQRPAIVLFWRTDCAPCLLELENLPALRQAAGSDPLLLVAMQSRDAVRAGLQRLGRAIPTRITAEDPAKVLIRLGGAPARLPQAVALDRQGNICRTRHGLVGSNTVRQWTKACD
jgi:thiol-disulfide isomerase/thioredoxin